MLLHLVDWYLVSVSRIISRRVYVRDVVQRSHEELARN